MQNITYDEFLSVIVPPGFFIYLLPHEEGNGDGRSFPLEFGRDSVHVGHYTGSEWVAQSSDRAKLKKAADKQKKLQSAVRKKGKRAGERYFAHLYYALGFREKPYVAPDRMIPGESFDRECHVRALSSVWIDVDDIDPSEIPGMLKDAELPEPSIIISSGHGAHVLWLLDQTYHIDDAGPSVPVILRKEKKPGDKYERTHQYVKDSNGVEVELGPWNAAELLPPLSPRAIQFKEVLFGFGERARAALKKSVAKSDHVHDLTRRLRGPESTNFKGARKQAADWQPPRCHVVVWKPDQRCSFASLQEFRQDLPTVAERVKVSEEALGLAKRKLSKAQREKFNKYTALYVAGADRSKLDHGLLCMLIRWGLTETAAYGLAQNHGKFADRGPDYFSRSWLAAMHDVVDQRDQKKKEPQVPGIMTAVAAPIDETAAASSPTRQHLGLVREGADGEPVRSTPAPIGVPDEITRSIYRSGIDNRAKVDVCDTDQDPCVRKAIEVLREKRAFYYDDEGLCYVNERRGFVKRRADQKTVAKVLARYIDTQVPNFSGGRRAPSSSVEPPDWMIKGVLSDDSHGEFEKLDGVCRRPMLTASGRLIRTAGYDPETHLFFATEVEEFPEIETTREAALAALEKLRDAVCDFPWRGEVDFAAWLSLVLTLAIRRSIDDLTPLYFITANTAGAGKTRIATFACIIATGEDPVVDDLPPNKEEQQKAAFTAILANTPLVVYDNLEKSSRISTLEQAVTTRTRGGRILGTNDQAVATVWTVWCLNGNNIVLMGDMPRRAIPILLYSPHENPESQVEKFKYKRIVKRIRQQQRELFVAALTIVMAYRSYLAEGGELPVFHELGSFEEWSEAVCAPIVWMGLPDPTSGQSAFAADHDNEKQVALCLHSVWQSVVGSGESKLSEFTKKAYADADHREALEEHFGTDDKKAKNKIAQKIKNLLNKNYAGLRFVVRSARSNQSFYSVEQVNPAASETQHRVQQTIPEGEKLETASF